MRSALVTVLGSIVVTSLAIACGSSDNAPGAPTNPNPPSGTGSDAGVTANSADASVPGTDAGTSTTPSGYPAFKPDVPQVQTESGPTLATPKTLPVFYKDYPYQDQIVKFSSQIGATDFWKANVSEYGVGAIDAKTAVVLSETAPANLLDSQIQAWLASVLDGKHAEFGAPDPNVIYTLYYPASTTITIDQSGGPTPDAGAPHADGGARDGGAGDGGAGGGTTGPGRNASCGGFLGYHANINMNGTLISYAVIPTCPPSDGSSEIDSVTLTASHELIEAATDPYPYDKPAYDTVDDDHAVWELLLGGGEIGDMCAQFSSSYVKPTGLDFMVQRSWSNASAAAGHDPCVPAIASQPYFNAMPVFDTVSAKYGGQTFQTKGVQIAVGQSKTIEVDLFSDAPTSGPWTVSATDMSRTPSLDFSFDKTTGVNGDKLQLTITAKTAPSTKRGLAASTFMIQSTLGTVKHDWFGIVVN